MMALPTAPYHDLFLSLGIVLGAFVSEDAATLAAAALASSKMLDVTSALLSAFLGLWVSDFGVYAAVRVAREKLPARSVLSRWLNGRLISGVALPEKQGRLGLALSRFLPGTRFPAYVAAGLFRMPVSTFAGITAASAALWTAVVFLGVHLFPAQIAGVQNALVAAGFAGLALFVVITLWRVWGPGLRAEVVLRLAKWRRWEFWPAWLFYPPVALMCGWLAIRFRGLALPTVSNPGQRNGGIIGESKFEILRDLIRVAPGFTAPAFLISPGTLAERLHDLESRRAQSGISFPFVLKPDSAQRGAGFRKIRSWSEAGAYLEQVKSAVVLQQYVAGPLEAGIFYYRFPREERGHIFSITRKVFPHVVGDGKRTLAKLIRGDSRASLIASTYLSRFGARVNDVVPEGEKIRLVEAGNHCQGCIFEDGADLKTEALRGALDGIARELPGFYIGRFDVRYQNDDEVRNGAGFSIIELNGASSEATNIYDARNCLWSAYRTLYQQWKLVYAIGAENRRLGIAPASPWAVLRDWKQFRKQAAYYPLAD